MTSTVPSAGDFLEQGDSPPYCWLVQGGARSAQKWIRFRSADALRLERAWGEAETIRRHADVVATAARGRRVAIDMKFSLKENAVPMDSTPSKASKEQQIPVPVFCGRYEVDVENLVMRSVYWEEEERVVVRSLWFHNEEEPEPYGEEDNTALEDGLRNLQSSTSSTLVVPLQAAFGLAEVRFRKNADAGIGEQFTATHESRGSNSSKQAVWRGCRLPPPEDEGEEEALPCNVECLVFVCHGIGTFRSVVPFHKFRTNVEAMRRLMVKYLNRKRQTGETLPGRIEFLPLEWSASVHGRVDPVLKSVTLPTAGSLRHFVNFAVADVVVYETLEWRNEIQSELRQKMERIYTLFKQRNTNFSGEVAVIGHSLGSVIMFDLLHSAVSVPDVSNPREEDEASECARPSGDVNASRKRRSNRTTIHQYSAAFCPRRGQSFEDSKIPTDAVAQAALANAISSNDHDDGASIERKAAFDSDADSQKKLVTEVGDVLTAVPAPEGPEKSDFSSSRSSSSTPRAIRGGTQPGSQACGKNLEPSPSCDSVGPAPVDKSDGSPDLVDLTVVANSSDKTRTNCGNNPQEELLQNIETTSSEIMGPAPVIDACDSACANNGYANSRAESSLDQRSEDAASFEKSSRSPAVPARRTTIGESTPATSADGGNSGSLANVLYTVELCESAKTDSQTTLSVIDGDVPSTEPPGVPSKDALESVASPRHDESDLNANKSAGMHAPSEQLAAPVRKTIVHGALEPTCSCNDDRLRSRWSTAPSRKTVAHKVLQASRQSVSINEGAQEGGEHAYPALTRTQVGAFLDGGSVAAADGVRPQVGPSRRHSAKGFNASDSIEMTVAANESTSTFPADGSHLDPESAVEAVPTAVAGHAPHDVDASGLDAETMSEISTVDTAACFPTTAESQAGNFHLAGTSLRTPVCFFAFGSPLGMCLNIRLTTASKDAVRRYLHCLGARVQTPSGAPGEPLWRFYNIYHPNDPVAYRLEPLLNKRYTQVNPRLLGCESFWKRALAANPKKANLRDLSLEVLKEVLVVEPDYLDNLPCLSTLADVADENVPSSRIASASDPGAASRFDAEGRRETSGTSDGRRSRRSRSMALERIDYSMQASMLETMGDWFTLIQSHAIYWHSEDVVHFLVDQLLEALASRKGIRRRRPYSSVGSGML